jgi:hypothetical protein
MAMAGVRSYFDSSGNLVFTKLDGTAIFSINTAGTISIAGIEYTFPTDNGDAGEQLQTDGSGVLTWEASGV